MRKPNPSNGQTTGQAEGPPPQPLVMSTRSSLKTYAAFFAPGNDQAQNETGRRILAGALQRLALPADDAVIDACHNAALLGADAVFEADAELLLRDAVAALHPPVEARVDWSTPPPPRRWLIDGWLSRGRPALLSGRGGAGKSKIGLQLCHAVASHPAPDGRRWMEGGPAINGTEETAVFATWEDDADEMSRRLLDCPRYGWNPASPMAAAQMLGDDLGDRFHAIDLVGCGPLWIDNGDRRPALTRIGADLRAHCETVGARLLVIDPLASAYGGNENDRGAVRSFLGSWDAWARQTDCTILIVAHPPKGNGGDDGRYSGSTDWRNAVRSFLHLDRTDGEPNTATLIADKVSYGPSPPPVELRDWVWWRAISTESAMRAKEQAADMLADDIVDLLRKDGPLAQSDIFDRLQGRHATIREALRHLVAEKRIADTRTNNRLSYAV